MELRSSWALGLVIITNSFMGLEAGLSSTSMILASILLTFLPMLGNVFKQIQDLDNETSYRNEIGVAELVAQAIAERAQPSF